MTHRGQRAVLSLCVLGLLMAGCGTTVPSSERLASGQQGLGTEALGDAPLGGTGPGGSGQSAVPGGPGSAGAVEGPAVGDAGTSTGTGGGTGAPADGAGATAIVQDKTPIKLGAFYLNGGNAALGAGFAATPVNFGDGPLEAKAVVADINARGGVGGRPIQLVLQKIEAADANKPEAFDAACTSLAQDHHVFAIMSMFNMRSPIAACAAKHKVLLLDTALGAGDDVIYRQYGDWAFTPSQMSLDTEQKLVLANAAATGVISPKVKVGLVVQNDDDIFPRVQKNTIEPTLRSLGVPYVSMVITNAQDSSGIASAILKFQNEGVTVVQFSAGNGGLPEVLFMQAAEQQQFRPTYIMGDSTDTWFVGNSAPRGQAEKVTGVGSYPIANVNADQVPPNAAEKHCLDVISKAGEPVSDRHSSLTATFYCEMFYGFTAAGALVQGPMTADKWRAAYRSLGARYPTIMSFKVDVSKNPNAGARAYRTLAWSSACECVAYTSGLRYLT